MPGGNILGGCAAPDRTDIVTMTVGISMSASQNNVITAIVYGEEVTCTRDITVEISGGAELETEAGGLRIKSLCCSCPDKFYFSAQTYGETSSGNTAYSRTESGSCSGLPTSESYEIFFKSSASHDCETGLTTAGVVIEQLTYEGYRFSIATDVSFLGGIYSGLSLEFDLAGAIDVVNRPYSPSNGFFCCGEDVAPVIIIGSVTLDFA